MTDLWIVELGEAYTLETGTALPLADLFGRDWCLVEASSPQGAIKRALRIDSAEAELNFLIEAQEWTGSAVDRLLWHLSTPVEAEGEPELFLRFGPPPRDGQSLNYLTRRYEAGMAVYDVTDLETAYRLDDEGIVTPTGLFLSAGGKIPYLVEGVRIGEGSDGEPVIGSYDVISPLRYSSQGIYKSDTW